MLTLALCTVVSAPLTARTTFDTYDDTFAPAWTARDLLPSQSTGSALQLSVCAQHSEALPGLPAASQPSVEVKRLTQPVALAEMDAILSAGIPADFKALTPPQSHLAKYAATANSIRNAAVTAVSAFVSSHHSLQLNAPVLADHSHHLALLAPSGIFVTTCKGLSANLQGSAAHPQHQSFEPQREVIIMSTNDLNPPSSHAALLSVSIDQPRQLNQLLPPIELQLLSRFGFMPNFGSTAMAVYEPVAITTSEDNTAFHSLSMQAFANRTQLVDGDAVNTSHCFHSPKKGFISSAPSPRSQPQVSYLSADSGLSNSTERIWHLRFTALPQKLHQWLQQ